jgi:transcription elongation factor GreA
VPSETTTIAIGSRVVYRDERDGEVEAVVIARAGEADASRGVISRESPLGMALLDRRPGDRVRARTPGGVRLLHVLTVEAQH